MDSVAVAYLDFYSNEKLTHEKRVLDVVKRSGGVDMVRRLLNEQDVCGNGDADLECIEINESTERFYYSVIDVTTSVENERPIMELNGGIVDETQLANTIPVPELGMQVSVRAKKRTKTKPKKSRRKRSILWRLEQARKMRETGGQNKIKIYRLRTF